MTSKPTYKELAQRIKELERDSIAFAKMKNDYMESAQRFRLLYERAPLSYQSLDQHGHITEVNQAWLDTLGYSREEVIGKSFGDFLHPDWSNHFKQSFDRFKAVGEILGQEFEMVRKDGSIIWVSFTGKIGRNDKGEFQQTHCIFDNITERRKAEEEVELTHQIQSAINKLLHLSLENTSLPEILEHFINSLTSFPLVGFEPIGAALLVEDEPGLLVLEAQRNLSAGLQKQCAKVPFGRCLCGRAASTGEIVFADTIDERHENLYTGIRPHGHYCVPIKSHQKKVIGVFTLYTKEGCKRDEKVEEFLLAFANVATVIIERKRTETALKKAHNELEQKVVARTSELAAINYKMKQEIQERKLTEKALRQSEAELEKQKAALEETNTALKVLLNKVKLDKQEIEEQVLVNVKELVEPYLEKLKGSGLNETQKIYTDILASNINDIVSPFVRSLSLMNLKLTPSEIKVANLIKQDKTTKEIAEIMNLSSETIHVYRRKIRKKMGITHKNINLRTMLSSFQESG